MMMAVDESGRTGRSFLARHPVAAFFVLAFLISWGGVLAIILPTGIPGSVETIDQFYGWVILPMLAGPSISAFIMSAYLDGRAGPAELLRRLTMWRARPLEYAASFLLIPTCALAVLLTLSLVTPAFTPGFLDPDSGFTMIALVLVGGLVVGVIEETGWTGFAISRLISGYNLLALAIGLGLIHGFWHLLVALWVDGTEFGLVFIPYFLTLWVVALITMRILIVWVFARTGSTLLAAVSHASHTGWMFVIWPPATTPVQDLIWTTAFGGVGLAAVLSLAYFAPPARIGAR